MPKTDSKKQKNIEIPKSNPELMEFEKRIQKLSNEELKDMLLINTYKLAMTRAQLEAVIEILIKKKIMTYEDVWKRTNEIFKDN